MYWYIVRAKTERRDKLIAFFNKQKDTSAFIPRFEKWYSIKGKKDYILKDLYPDYVFIKTFLDKKQFDELYKDFFRSINGFAWLLDYDEVTSLTLEEQQLMEQMFQGGDVIRHSDGNIINKVLMIHEGPLKGMENNIIKIDRHHREATLQLGILNQKMKVSLNVISKS